jgi:hypothetical protein
MLQKKFDINPLVSKHHRTPYFTRLSQFDKLVGERSGVLFDEIQEMIPQSRLPCGRLQVPVEMGVLWSQPIFPRSGIVDATQFETSQLSTVCGANLEPRG